MNEEIEKAVETVKRTIEMWEEEKTRATALSLEAHLSLLKLILGINNFDQLPYFVRTLNEVTQWLNNNEKETK